MIYNNFQNEKISSLAMGCMRLPLKKGSDKEIDVDATREMVAYAFSQGVNYFDTAWGYHFGQSEPVMGEILQSYPRESFYLASKFPGYDLANMDKIEEIFEAQLKRCRVEYFDFYMFHNLCELNADAYLDAKYGLFDYLIEQKKKGRIRHLGFSTHATTETFLRFLDAYGKDMEFCQIQLNWLDWDFQNAKKKVEILSKRNIPVWVMEPVRGGKLATLEEKYAQRLRAFRPDATAAEWAFRFVQSVKGVTVTLSGMSNFDQLKENIAVFSEHKPVTDEERETLFDIASEMTGKKKLPCTACRYCVDRCPKGLDIPRLIELYNEHNYSDGGFIAPMAMSALDEDKKPNACVACRACEKVCPQNIKISEMMADFSAKLKND